LQPLHCCSHLSIYVSRWWDWQRCCCKLGECWLWQQQQQVCASTAKLLQCFLDITPRAKRGGPAVQRL
jgi:hypothetical protein